MEEKGKQYLLGQEWNSQYIKRKKKKITFHTSFLVLFFQNKHKSYFSFFMQETIIAQKYAHIWEKLVRLISD